jgi:hypothetical protein
LNKMSFTVMNLFLRKKPNNERGTILSFLLLSQIFCEELKHCQKRTKKEHPGCCKRTGNCQYLSVAWAIIARQDKTLFMKDKITQQPL